ncbi:acyl-CoA dehydrogenase family protein [Candidatus Burkholderia verschuerenii]|uniref:acyl-CoA dehydrogenase family protein n=1 Tax=Candidatus Burkholderia verschuerenii TaxID=242163 RepID=UPI00067B37C8|nr:acyl-CoA dehydrogenase family protein [Candidatus Burkholderia verschuerenii]
MDFEYSDEQRMLADSLRRYIDDHYTHEQRRKSMDCDAGFDSTVWGTLAEMGVMGLGVPVAFGGFSQSTASQLVVHLELGRGLLVEPVIPCAVMPSALLEAYASEAQKDAWLPGLAMGEKRVAIAYLETDSRYRTDRVRCTATPTQNGYTIDGAKCLIWHGQAADAWIVSARVGESIALFMVPRATDGIVSTEYATMDGQRGIDLHFKQVKLPASALIGGLNNELDALDHALDHGIAAQCAQAAGAMERVIDITRDYLCTRRQFGQPLADFQALQHRLADMLVQKESALSMAYVAAQAVDEPDTLLRRRMISAAKVTVAKAARLVGQQAVQLHGGMGITDELSVGDYFKHLTMTDVLLGDADYHVERYCAAMAD